MAEMVPHHQESSQLANITKLIEYGENTDYGNDIQKQFDHHYREKLEQQASEATKVVHLEKKIQGPPSVLEEFAQLEKLYLGTGGSEDRGSDAGPNNHTGHSHTFSDVNPEDEEAEERIATEILFVQKTYLSKTRDTRLRIATQVAEDAVRFKRRAAGKDENGADDDDEESDAEGDKEDKEELRETALEIRGRMQMDLVQAELNAENFETMLVKEGMNPVRAKQVSRGLQLQHPMKNPCCSRKLTRSGRADRQPDERH